MATDRIVGIDLGTTNSLVAFMQGEEPVVIPGEDGLNLVPSVIALGENDQVIVGSAARKYLIETAERAVMEGDGLVRRRGKPCIQPSDCGSVSAAVGGAIWLGAVATDMRADSRKTMRES